MPGQSLNLPVMGVVLQVPVGAASGKGSLLSQKACSHVLLVVQVRIPSKVDKPGTSPIKLLNQEVSAPFPAGESPVSASEVWELHVKSERCRWPCFGASIGPGDFGGVFLFPAWSSTKGCKVEVLSK